VEEEGQSHGIIEGRGDGGVLHIFYHTTLGLTRWSRQYETFLSCRGINDTQLTHKSCLSC